ncbi:bud site selection protein Rax2p [Trichomonascus vanleenenianus]|uniref:Rax2p n=1 Tax=Trichomonascus vanleenenianus TaxID=2268995 RepID=UPI003EC9C098
MKRLVTALLAALWAKGAMATIAVESVVVPSLDLQEMGSIGIVGQFDGISTYTYQGQQNASIGDSSNRIVAQVDGNYLLPQAELDGSVTAACQIDDIVYFAGDFSTVGDLSTQGIASVNATSGEVASLAKSGAPAGSTVKTLYCDSSSGLVYAGGSFAFNETAGVAVWDVSKSQWRSPLFGGFKNSSVVNAIEDFGDSLVFGGNFTGLANSSFTSNHTAGNFSSIARRQVVSFSSATVTGTGGVDDSTASSITCPGGSGWSLTNNRAGMWKADWPFFFTPTRLRLYNLKDSDNGLKEWYLLSFPINGIMNFSYVDPDTQQTKYCDQACPLAPSSQAEYMDFFFVNPISMDSIQLDLNGFYGQAAGLSGIQLFSSDLVTFANNELNEPQQCNGSPSSSGGSATNKGSGWTNQLVEQQNYMSTTITDASQLSQVSSVLEPNITVSGNYTFQLYTPGCVADGTCATRGGVTAKVYYADGEDPITKTIYQNNDNQKYDTLYTGQVDAMSGKFRPRIELTPLPNQNVPLTFVSQSAQIIFQGSGDGDDNGDQSGDDDDFDSSSSGSVNLNGLFEFSKDNFTKLTKAHLPVGNTPINSLFSNTSNVEVTSLVNLAGKLFVGGTFSTSNYGDNMLQFDENSNPGKVDGSGVSDGVDIIAAAGDDSTLVVSGSFNSTQDGKTKLSNYGFYDAQNSKWVSTGNNSSDAPTSSISAVVPLKVNGTSSVGLSYNNDSMAVWINNEQKWLDESKLKDRYVSGHLYASASAKNTYIYFGSLQTLENRSPSGALLSDQLAFKSMNFDLENGSSSSTSNSTKTKRSGVVQSVSGNTINVGTFANATTSIVGGHFTAQDEDGNIYKNVVIINNGNVSGIPDNAIEDDSIIYALLASDNQLYIGGNLQSKTGNIGGLLFYDLNRQNLSSDQPPALSGGEGIVTTLMLRPNSNDLIVMGSFEQAGSLGCSSFCVYDTKDARWNTPSGGGLSGLVSSGVFIDTGKIFFAGDMKLNGTKSYFAQYDFDSSVYTSYESVSNSLPGPVNSFVLSGDEGKNIFASGTDSSSNEAYLAFWNTQSWQRLDENFEQGTVITDLKLLGLKTSHNENDILPADGLLLVSGNIVLKDFGNVSSIMYDGNNWQPLFLTARDSSSGVVNAVFSQSDQTFQSLFSHSHLAKGFVVLISLAISLGLILLLVASGLLVSYIKKRKQGYRPAPSRVSELDMTETVPPANLFEEMGNVGRR